MSKQTDSKNKTKPLNARQKRFCEEYVVDLNATQAAIRAGYSERTAQVQSSRLLLNVMVQEYIAELQKEIQERNKITIDECVSILASIARFDIKDLYFEEGGMKPIHQIPKNARIAIAGIESIQLFEWVDGEQVPSGILKKVKTINKEGAIDKLLKHLGGYGEHNKQKETNNVVIFNLPDNGRG